MKQVLLGRVREPLQCMKRLTGFPTPQFTTPVKYLVNNGLYPQALRVSADSLDPCLTDQVYSLFTKSGFFLDIFLGSYLISHFSKLCDLQRAHQFFMDMPETDIVVWNTLISGYAKSQQIEDAFRLFRSLRHCELKPDIFTVSSLIKACNFSQNNEIAHVVSIKMGFSSGAFVSSCLINNYSKDGNIVSAEKCFGECLVMDTVVWTTMIFGYVQNEEAEMARNCFIEMEMSGILWNQFSLASVLGALSDTREGESIHGLSIKIGFLAQASTPLSNAIMSMYCKFGSKTNGIKMFSDISEPDVVSGAALIGFAGDGEEALELYKFLCWRDIEINEYTLINVLSAIGNSRLLKPGKEIHAYIYKIGYLSVISIGNVLISMYGKCESVEDAKKVFEEMLYCDAISWNTVIAGYTENGLFSLALEMFVKMRHSSLKPTKCTLASILEVLSNSKYLNLAKGIHGHIIKSGFCLDDSMVTGLITTYGNCNEIENSKQLYFEIDKIILAQVNAMIATFVHSGYHVDALKFLQDTWGSGVEVNGVTFSVALKACAALTTLEQGKILHSLALKCGFDQDHFLRSAIIDFYCKCGSIDDGSKAFKETLENNLASWNAMMMGYAQHGNNEEVFKLFGEMQVRGMDPDEISYLGLLSSCCHSRLVEKAYSLLKLMFEHHGVMPQLEHYSCVVDLLGRVGDLEKANMLVEEMPVNPDAQIWHVLLSNSSIHGNLELGKVFAAKLLQLEPETDTTYVLLSNLYASAGIWNEVRRLRKLMKDNTICKEPGVSWIQLGRTVHSFLSSDVSHSRNREICLKLQQLNKQMRASSSRGGLEFDWGVS